MDWFKCNFDCSYKRDEVETGIGWIIRDYIGKFVFFGGVKLIGILIILEGEVIVFLYVV